MSWRFSPSTERGEPVAGAAGLRSALSTGPRTEALAAWLSLTHRADTRQVAHYSHLLSTNPDVTDLEAHLAARVARRPTPARVEDLAHAARHSAQQGATAHRHLARSLDNFGDTVEAGCPVNPDRHLHTRTGDGWLCGDTVKRAAVLIAPRPADR